MQIAVSTQMHRQLRNKNKFDVLLTFDEWKKIEPVETIYGDSRNYLMLQSGQIFLQKKFGYNIEYHVLGHLKILKKQQQQLFV